MYDSRDILVVMRVNEWLGVESGGESWWLRGCRGAQDVTAEQTSSTLLECSVLHIILMEI